MMMTEAIIFSQMRGTARKTVGKISLMSWVTVSTLSAKLTVAPEWMGRNTDMILSATWHNGRYDTISSVSYWGMTWAWASRNWVML